MAKGDKNKLIRRRLRGAYVSSVVSISFVLLLVGMATLILFNARRVSDRFKENVRISVLMKCDVDETRAAAYAEEIAAFPGVLSTRLVSRQEGTDELKSLLGEDFLSVFETSPVPVSVDVSLHAEYVCQDSLDVVIPQLSASDLVDEVSCPQPLVKALDSNLAKISLVFGVLLLVFLFISVVLINNTVRLSVFSERFTIHTMKLVGATEGFIRRPFLRSAFFQGLVSSVLALCMLASLIFLLFGLWHGISGIFSFSALALSGACVVLCGPLVCVSVTWVIVGKLVEMDKDDLYC